MISPCRRSRLPQRQIGLQVELDAVTLFAVHDDPEGSQVEFEVKQGPKGLQEENVVCA
jgi:cold shock CspA family protein